MNDKKLKFRKEDSREHIDHTDAQRCAYSGIHSVPARLHSVHPHLRAYLVLARDGTVLGFDKVCWVARPGRHAVASGERRVTAVRWVPSTMGAVLLDGKVSKE